MNVLVSNLMSFFNEEDLRKIFSAFGKVVSCQIITDKYTGASRGFGFVEMSTGNEGMEAIAQLDGKLVHGRPIAVSMAKAPRRLEGRNFR